MIAIGALVLLAIIAVVYFALSPKQSPGERQPEKELSSQEPYNPEKIEHFNATVKEVDPSFKRLIAEPLGGPEQTIDYSKLVGETVVIRIGDDTELVRNVPVPSAEFEQRLTLFTNKCSQPAEDVQQEQIKPECQNPPQPFKQEVVPLKNLKAGDFISVIVKGNAKKAEEVEAKQIIVK